MAAAENVKETASIALSGLGFMNLTNIKLASLLTKLLIHSSSFSTSRTTKIARLHSDTTQQVEVPNSQYYLCILQLID